MNLTDAVNIIERSIADPRVGLPEEVFLAISRLTPMVNVDLLVKDEDGRTLLAWRDDDLSGAGWHVPGGVVRFLERLETRVEKVAKEEIGVPVAFDPVPIAFNQLLLPALPARNHFLSILYRCSLSGGFIPDNRGRTETTPGFLKWHETCPDNLIEVHRIYRHYI